MKKKIKIIGLQGIPLIKQGDNIPKIILDAIKTENISLENGDILVIAQTIISKSLGRVRDLTNIKPSKKAFEIYETITLKAKSQGIPFKSPELIQAILDESKEIIKSEHVLITETSQGFICANAGIDKSNVEGETRVSLLPVNSDKEADKIRSTIKEITGKDVAIIITDSFGRPFRIGAVGVAIGVSGINPILDKRGDKDLFGYELQSTIIGQIDNLASAAQLVMGESNEGIPVVLFRGYKYVIKKNASIQTILRDRKIDIFRSDKGSSLFVKILKNRRSYKFEFASENVDKKLIEKCIEIARWAPSAHNRQQWRYIIIEKGMVRENLINSMNQKLRSDLEKDGKLNSFINKKVNKTRKDFMEAPYLILICLDTSELDNYSDTEQAQNEYILGVQSISASATYLLLAFELKNLAACWYCAPLFTKEIVKSTLKLPDSFIPMAFFTVGYPLKTSKAPKRKDLKKIIFELKMNKD